MTDFNSNKAEPRKGRMTKLALGFAVLALSGCTMLIPDYQRPYAPVATDWPSGIEVRVDEQNPSAARLPWYDFFVDDQLRQLISLSLENNRDMRVAALNVERAQAQFRIQRAPQWPTLNVILQDQRYSPNSVANTATYGVNITSYEVDFFGRLQSLKEAALAQYLATAEARNTTQISLVSSVAMAYFGLLADEELLKVTIETLKTRENSLELTKHMFDNGVVSELDLRQAEELYESARATLAQVRRQRAMSMNTLVLLLGQPALPEGLSLERGLSGQQALLAAIPVGLPSDMLVNRPDIRSAEQQLIAANANIGAARAAFFPRIVLTGTFGRSSGSLNDLFDDATRMWTFLPQITLPIFDAGTNRANLDIAKAEHKIAIAQYESAIQSAFREVADALAGTATWEEQLRATRAQAEAANKTFELSDMRYRNGVASYLDVLDAQRTLFLAQQGVIQAQLSQLQNQITLYKSLGGGWQNQPATLAETQTVAGEAVAR